MKKYQCIGLATLFFLGILFMEIMPPYKGGISMSPNSFEYLDNTICALMVLYFFFLDWQFSSGNRLVKVFRFSLICLIATFLGRLVTNFLMHQALIFPFLIDWPFNIDWMNNFLIAFLIVLISAVLEKLRLTNKMAVQS